MAELAVQKDVPKLKAGDRISIIKNKPSFSLVFSVIILVLYLYDGEPGYFRGELHGAGGYHRRADL